MIRVFGIGANGLQGLSTEARVALEGCQTLFGGGRHLALMPKGIAKHPWPKPWKLPLEEIANSQGPVGVLVSGDPSWHSAATALYSHFDCQVFPAPGAFSLAAARMGWPLENVTTSSIHGRDVKASVHALSLGGKHLILSDRKSLKALIEALNALAFTPVQSLTLLENLGGEEMRTELDLEAPAYPKHDLFTIAAEIEPQPRLLLDADFLPDEAFETHGKITKFDARTSAVAQLRRADILWDVGAGAGTVGLQAAYTLQTDLVVLIENDADAWKILERNCANSSAPAQIIKGKAPKALANLPEPNAIFIGGGLSNPSVLSTCWKALLTGGRLVAHAVTLESEAVLLDFFKTHSEAGLNRVHVSTAQAVGTLYGWRPTMPLTQLVIEKS